LEGVVLIPIVIDGVYFGIIRAVEVAAELEVIRRVGENQIDGIVGKGTHHFYAFAYENRIDIRIWGQV